MANKNPRLAVASTDGRAVDSHFGKASTFFIYELQPEGVLELLERVEVTPICNGGSHDEALLAANLARLAAADYIIAARMGDGAMAAALRYGIESYELPGTLADAVTELQRNIELKKILEGDA